MPRIGDREDVVSIEQGWPEALARRDRQWLERHTDENFIFIRPDGVMITRDAYLDRSENAPHVASRVNKVDIVNVVGDVAIVIGRVQFEASESLADEIPLRYRYSGVYVRSGGVWRAVSAQLTPFSATAEWGDDLAGR